jgi:hypothetical protein
LLHDLETEESVPGGARFEARVYADRVLGMELAREVTQLRG